METISIIKILKLELIKLITTKICDINRKIFMIITKGTTQITK